MINRFSHAVSEYRLNLDCITREMKASALEKDTTMNDKINCMMAAFFMWNHRNKASNIN
jgi:hypothetical protein